MQKGKSKYINALDKLCEFQANTRAFDHVALAKSPLLANQAKCVVVDFTVLTRDFQPPNFNFASMASARCPRTDGDLHDHRANCCLFRLCAGRPAALVIV